MRKLGGWATCCSTNCIMYNEVNKGPRNKMSINDLFPDDDLNYKRLIERKTKIKRKEKERNRERKKKGKKEKENERKKRKEEKREMRRSIFI